MKRSPIITFCLLQTLIFITFTVNAQNTDKKNTEMILPIIPLITEYEYTPVYLSQDIKDHPIYWRIIATFDPKNASSVEIALIEKDSSKRTYYCNSETNVAKRKMQGYEAVLAKIDFKPSESNEGLSIYGFGFADKNNQPVLWRVIPTTAPSIRGKGIDAVTDVSSLRIEYRDFGTMVGEGTAVKIGEKIFEAEPFPKASSPPYFYAYHGSFTIGRHLGALHFRSEKWSVTKNPEKLKKGESWILTNENGHKHTLEIVSDKNNELVIEEKNLQFKNSSQLRIVLHIVPTGYNLRTVEIHEKFNNKRQMSIKFEPELLLQTSETKDFEGKFMIDQGETQNIVTGIITRKQLDKNSVSYKWQPKSPEWAKQASFESLINITANGYSIETK